jgi:hypothetical protein
MRYLFTGSLLLVALIHLLPLIGVISAARLSTLYGIEVTDPTLEILLRHRAVLFGLLGGFLAFAAFRPALQPLALLAGWISVLSFLALASAVGGYNAQLTRVFNADLIALVALVIASVIWFKQPSV